MLNRLFHEVLQTMIEVSHTPSRFKVAQFLTEPVRLARPLVSNPPLGLRGSESRILQGWQLGFREEGGQLLSLILFRMLLGRKPSEALAD